MFDSARIPTELIPAYREKQTDRLRFNLRAALLFGAPVALFFIVWEFRHDPENIIPGAELLAALTLLLVSLFFVTYLTPSRNALGAITVVATLASICLIVWLHAALSDMLAASGVLLVVLIVTTILAVDLGIALVGVLALAYFVAPNIALLVTNSSSVVALDTNWVLIPGLFVSAGMAYMMDRSLRKSFMLEVQLAKEKERSEELLRALLPVRIAEELKNSDRYVAEVVPNASVLFADLVGFTPLTQKLSAEELISILNEVFSRLDAITSEHGLEKIKTIGDSYMVGAGVADAVGCTVDDLAGFAIDARAAVNDFVSNSGYPLSLRVGLSQGTVISGVIGRRKPHYDIWGATVNLANRLEETAPSGCIQLDYASARMLRESYDLVHRGPVAMDGIGAVDTFLLNSSKLS